MSEKCALITGASRGIGAAIALRLAKDGFNIAINCRSGIEKAQQVAEEIRKLGRRAEVFQADVADEQQCADMVKAVVQSFGGIDVLVNNAGITKDGLLLRMSPSQFDDVINTNLRSAFLMIRYVSPIMLKARSGRIINIASVAGVYGNQGQANYSASKAGLIGLTKSVSKELGSRGINCNAVAPGLISTDMAAQLGEETQKAINERTSLKRIGRPEEIAAAVSFLASKDSSYITGQVLLVDGGLSL